jgi:hypothetical protein
LIDFLRISAAHHCGRRRKDADDEAEPLFTSLLSGHAAAIAAARPD